MGKPPFASVGPASLTSLKLQTSEQLSPNTKKLRFELPEPDVKSGLGLTSALLSLSFPPKNGRWTPVLRPYTPTNDLNETGFIEFIIKAYPGGKQSTLIHSLKPGDRMTFMRIPGLSYKPNQYTRVALIAGGAGITPMYQLVRGILTNPEDQTHVTLVWGVNSQPDLFLKDEFAALEEQHKDRFRALYAVSDGSVEEHHQGRVTAELLEGAGLSAKDMVAAAEGKSSAVKVMVCGPPAMEKALATKGSGILAALGYTPDQVYKF